MKEYMNSTLKSLVENLNAKKIIIIENDFTFIDDVEELLSRICLFNETELNELVDDIVYEDNDLNHEKIRAFVQIITGLEHQDKNKYLESGKILTFFEMMEMEDGNKKSKLIAETSSILDEIKKLMNNTNNRTFLKYGLSNDIPKDYSELIGTIKLIENTKLRIYKDVGETIWNEIESEVLKNYNENEYLLFIVDKNLGADNSQGEEFIRRFLINNLKQQKKLNNIVSVLYTSKKVDLQLEDYNDCFTFQISKDDTNRIGNLTYSLAKCAYIDLFKQLKETHIQSYEYAFELAIKKETNMIYLANMAHEEGITAFESINKWFDLTRNMRLTELLLNSQSEKYKRVVNLTQYISEEFLLSMSSDFNIELTAPNINVYEIFDYTINLQHLTPVPGDIYNWGGKYYILVGQDCDFTVRNNNYTREAKVVDLVEAKFIRSTNYTKVDVENYGKIILNYFKDSETEEIGALEINLNNRITADFSVLDLGTFNKDGKCILNTKETLDPIIERMLPRPWKKHHENLQLRMNTILEIDGLVPKEQNFLRLISCNDISLFHYDTPMDDSLITFSLERVCRLKNEFKELLNKSYWDYRGRIGVNTINIDKNEKIICSKVKIGYIGQEKDVDIVFLGLLSKSNKRKTDLEKAYLPFEVDLKKIKEKFHEVYDLSSLTDEISLSNDEVFINDIRIEKYVDDNALVGIKISLPYKINGKAKISKTDIKITQLLPQFAQKLKCDDSLYFLYGDNGQQRSFLHDGQLYSLNIFRDISRGMKIPQLGIEVFIDNGDIVVRTIMDESAADIE
jgi:hypothetical protein